MELENLTSEIEDWLEKADEEENLRFLTRSSLEYTENIIVIEILGYYGSVGQLVAEEIKKLSHKNEKLAGFFSSYFSEMIQLSSDEILLPITLLKLKIGSQSFILTTSSFAIPDVVGYRLAEELLEFYRKLNVSKIILIDGVYNSKRKIDQSPQVHTISSSNYKIDITNLKKADFTLMGQIACSFLTYWLKSDEIPIEMVVSDSFSDYDPISSLELIKNLIKKWGIKEADFSELRSKSHEFTRSYLISSEELKEDDQNSITDPRFFI